MGNRLLPAHADAVITDRDGAFLGVRINFDFELGAFRQQRRLCDGRKTQSVVGV